MGTPAAPPDKKALPAWRAWIAGGYCLVVLAFGAWTWANPEDMFCSSSTETTEPGVVIEMSAGADGRRSESKSTQAEASETTTDTCTGLSVAQVGLLLLPAVGLVWPAIKGFSIAGIGIDLWEVKEAAAKEATEQVIRIVMERQVGESVREGFAESERVDPDELPRLS